MLKFTCLTVLFIFAFLAVTNCLGIREKESHERIRRDDEDDLDLSDNEVLKKYVQKISKLAVKEEVAKLLKEKKICNCNDKSKVKKTEETTKPPEPKKISSTTESTGSDGTIFDTTSKILSSSQEKRLGQWLQGVSASGTYKRCWSSSNDGVSMKTFHSLCDGKKNTVTVAKLETYGRIIGGFTDCPWYVSQQGCGSKSFLFDMTTKINYPVKSGSTKAVCMSNTKYGPCFGEEEFRMYNKLVYEGGAYVKKYVNTIRYHHATNKDNYLNFGRLFSPSFKVVEAEVWYKA